MSDDCYAPEAGARRQVGSRLPRPGTVATPAGDDLSPDLFTDAGEEAGGSTGPGPGSARGPRGGAGGRTLAGWTARRQLAARNPYPSAARKLRALAGLVVLTTVSGFVVALAVTAVAVTGYLVVAHAVGA